MSTILQLKEKDLKSFKGYNNKMQCVESEYWVKKQQQAKDIWDATQDFNMDYLLNKLGIMFNIGIIMTMNIRENFSLFESTCGST